MFTRKAPLPLRPRETFFLWGPRQSGKSTLIRQLYPEAPRIDLLKSEEFRRYTDRPETLREEVLANPSVPFYLVDEIQKVPALLDEVHWLIENQNIHFGLCGSSARKLRRGHANLLGGRAIRYELFGLVSAEIGDDFDLVRMINHGYLPRHYLSDRPLRLLNSYVADYIREEIAAEGLVRKLPVFSNFLQVASLSDTDLINFSNIGRDCGVSAHTVIQYFQILEDTLLGSWLPAYRRRPKRKVIGAPKFYFSDVGIVNFLAKRREIEPGSEAFGKAFENWVHHELKAYNAYTESMAELSYWRLASGIEVDFVLNQMEVAIEVKGSARITADHLKGLRNLRTDHPSIEKQIVVCLETRERKTEDGIWIQPYRVFCDKLWRGDIF